MVLKLKKNTPMKAAFTNYIVVRKSSCIQVISTGARRSGQMARRVALTSLAIRESVDSLCRMAPTCNICNT